MGNLQYHLEKEEGDVLIMKEAREFKKKFAKIADSEKCRTLPNISVVTHSSIPKAGIVPLSNLVNILSPFASEIHIITGDIVDTLLYEYGNIHIYKIRAKYKREASIFIRIVSYIHTQLRISYKLAKIARNVDLCFFLIGGEILLPILVAKLFKKKIILCLIVGPPKNTGKDILFKPTVFLREVNYALADMIIVYTENFITGFNLEKYLYKISIAHEHFLDFDKFKIKKKLNERDNLVGYIGRLSEEKGILNFVKAIPEILKEQNEVKFLVGGDGQLRDEIGNYLDRNNLNDKVKLTGWIPHNKLPDYLNELKLLVLPSYTEGLPNIMLEAMTCGTPVLATPVGAIPDVIKDGETGFIMENNSPECIAKNVVRALGYLDLERIVKNARELVEKEFTYKVAVERYRKILKELQ